MTYHFSLEESTLRMTGALASLSTCPTNAFIYIMYISHNLSHTFFLESYHSRGAGPSL